MAKWISIANWRIATKLSVGLAALVGISAVLGWMGWCNTRQIMQLTQVTTTVETCTEDILNARRWEKNFVIRGFEKHQRDKTNSVEKWHEIIGHLKTSLTTLADSAALVDSERAKADDGRRAVDGYTKAFQRFTELRRNQDRNYADWRRCGGEITHALEKVAERITPYGTAAEAARDVALMAAWARIERELHSQVAAPFFLLRTNAVVFANSKSAADWDNFQAQLATVKKGTVAWADLVQDRPELQARGSELVERLGVYEQAAHAFRQTVAASGEADAALVSTARTVGDSCDHLRESVNRRVWSTLNFIDTALPVLALVGIVLGVALALGIVRMVVRPILACMASIVALSRQDFSRKCQVRSHDELGQMAQAINQSIDATQKAFDDIRDAAQREQQAQAQQAEAERNRAELERQLQEEEASRERARAQAEHLRQEDEAARQAAQAEVERQKTADLRRKVDDLLEIVAAAAQGDLTREVVVEGHDAVDDLAAGIRKMLAALAQLIGQVADSAAQFTEGSQVIASSAQNLATGAQNQSASVEEMNASIEVLASSIQTVKDHALQADNVAKQTLRLAEEGDKAVRQSTDAMDLILSSSQQIGEIIRVISEIASQTNLLALNAAIEAARAGEHGLGFAVVADEVRKLAERSNKAAREISTLINESTKRVKEGAQLSTATGDSLRKIIDSVDATATRISHIAEIAVQQSSNAQEVAQAITGIAQVTEQTAAGSEQMAASSEQLGSQASVLRKLVDSFRTRRS